MDVQRVIEHIVALMQFEAEERKIRLERAIGKDLPPVQGDETQISQVLVNIVVNAFHAMANGGRCHIAAEAHTADGTRWVDIVVRDTGVGHLGGRIVTSVRTLLYDKIKRFRPWPRHCVSNHARSRWIDQRIQRAW